MHPAAVHGTACSALVRRDIVWLAWFARWPTELFLLCGCRAPALADAIVEARPGTLPGVQRVLLLQAKLVPAKAKALQGLRALGALRARYRRMQGALHRLL